MDAETADILYGLGRAQIATLEETQMQEPMDNLSRAFDYYVEAGDVARAVAVAVYPLPHNSRPAGSALVERVMPLVSPDSHEAGRLMSLHGLFVGMDLGDYEAAQEAIQRSLAIAQREGDIHLEMSTLFYAGRMDQYHLRYTESLEKNLRAIELAQRVGDPRAEVEACFYTASTQYAMGDLVGAQRTATAGLAVAESLGDRNWLSRELISIGTTSQAMGDWQAAREYSDRCLSVSPRVWMGLYIRTLLEHNVGEFVQGEAYLERLLEITLETAPRANTLCGYTALVIPLAARIAGVAERFEVAETLAETILSSPSTTPLDAVYARTSLALIAVHRRDVAEAGEQYAALVPVRGTALAYAMLAVDRLLGLLAHTTGQLDEAMAHFDDALAFCRRGGYRPELAWTCCDYADALRERGSDGDRAKAISLLDESLAISSELGMRPLMERVLSRREILGA